MDLIEKFLHGEQVFDGKLLKVYRDVVAMSDHHEEIREVIRHPGASVIVPRLANGRYVMVRQYRHAVGEVMLEFPAGRLDSGENPLLCAQRELVEETGYRAANWTLLFRFHPAPGYSDEILWVYLAENLTSGKSQPEPDEELMVTEFSPNELLQRFRAGEITDSKTVAALLFLELFNR
ncbi:MAG: NUDIX hydrolase [bacterium]